MTSISRSYVLILLALSWIGAQQPGNPTARFNRAVELQRQGALQEAVAEYQALLNANPNYVEALANLGGVLSRLGRYEESVDAYDRALKLAPQLTPLLLNLGIAHHRAGQFLKAVDTFQRVLEKDPAALQALQLLGISLVELGRDAEALPHLERAAQISPSDPAVLYSLGLASLRLGRPDPDRIISKLVESSSGLPASHLLKGQVLLSQFEYERAVAELEIAASLSADLPRVQYSMGLALLKLGRNKQAITSFEKELARTPRDFSTLYYLAYLNEADGNLDAAMERLSLALRLDPQSHEGNALLGKILLKQNKPAAAVAPLEYAVKGDPDDPDKHYALARVYQQLGRSEDAAREFSEVQRLKAAQLKNDRARTPKP
ncbi:MAG TPA: tetratricopeptide repeat protein [Blastocatellia bacterium]|jgi:tetratricopeptide (TPR) repeat protein|nr:tetratricopeptide repeat protein [Blastocatellia bacterium]